MKTKTRKEALVILKALFFVSGIVGILTGIVMLQGCLSVGTDWSINNSFGYKPGIYQGSGKGFRGPIYVQVQVSQAGIEDIVITSHKEEPYPGGAAMEELLESVLEQGSTDLDAISGASYSSRGFLDAVDEALGKATLNL